MSEQLWATILAAIPDVETWNRNLGEFKRLTEQYGSECREYIQTEAERRGYLYSKQSHCYVHPWPMRACDHPGRLIGVGFRSGQLAVVIKPDGKPPERYESEGHDISAETATKLVRSIECDALYKKLVVDKGIKMVRVG